MFVYLREGNGQVVGRERELSAYHQHLTLDNQYKHTPSIQGFLSKYILYTVIFAYYELRSYIFINVSVKIEMSLCLLSFQSGGISQL